MTFYTFVGNRENIVVGKKRKSQNNNTGKYEIADMPANQVNPANKGYKGNIEMEKGYFALP